LSSRRVRGDGDHVVESVTLADLRRCAALIEKYHDLELGLSDACVMAIGERCGTDRILTVDRKDFRVVRPLRGKPFRILPADTPK
jgi:predicted nucleic acid-binding protein